MQCPFSLHHVVLNTRVNQLHSNWSIRFPDCEYSQIAWKDRTGKYLPPKSLQKFHILSKIRAQSLENAWLNLHGNPCLGNGPILTPWKTLENPWFSGVFRGYKMGTLVTQMCSKSIFQDFALISRIIFHGASTKLLFFQIGTNHLKIPLLPFHLRNRWLTAYCSSPGPLFQIFSPLLSSIP